MLWSRGPASRMQTVFVPSAVRRFARTQPAAPAPTITQSNMSALWRCTDIGFRLDTFAGSPEQRLRAHGRDRLRHGAHYTFFRPASVKRRDGCAAIAAGREAARTRSCRAAEDENRLPIAVRGVGSENETDAQPGLMIRTGSRANSGLGVRERGRASPATALVRGQTAPSRQGRRARHGMKSRSHVARAGAKHRCKAAPAPL